MRKYLILLLLNCCAITQVAAQDLLTAESCLERKLEAGRSHIYNIEMQAGDYLELDILQKEIYLRVTFSDQDSKQLNYISEYPLKVISRRFWAEQSGKYSLKIEPIRKDVTGLYELKVVAFRPATARDRAIAEVERLIDGFRERIHKTDEALKLAEELLAVAEERVGTNDPLVAEILIYLGNIRNQKGEFAKVEKDFQRALDIRERVLGSEHVLTAMAMNILGLFYRDRTDFAKAKPLLEKSLEILERVEGDGSVATGELNSHIGGLYRLSGDTRRAEYHYRRAVEILDKLLGDESLRVSSAFNNLAIFYKQQDEFIRAEPLYKRSLQIAEKVLDAEHPSLSATLNNLATLYRDKGDYANAEIYYLRALEMVRRTLGSESMGTAITLNSLGALYQEKGDYAKAEPLLLKSVTIFEKIGGSENFYTAVGLQSLANLYRDKGEYTKAESLYRKAAAVIEKIQGGERPMLAVILSHIGYVLFHQGKFKEALEVYDRAKRIFDKELGFNAGSAGVAAGIARIYMVSKEFEKAEQFGLQALTVYEKTYGAESNKLIFTLHLLAQACRGAQKYERALEYLKRANRLMELDLQRNLISGSERQKQLYINRLPYVSDLTISLNINCLPDNLLAIEAALELILRVKGRSLDAMAGSIETLRKRASAEDKALLDELREKQAILTSLTLRGPGSAGAAKHHEKLKALAEEVERLESSIGQRSVEYRLQLQPVDLESVKKALPAGFVLLEYVVYRPYLLSEGKYGKSRYAVYVLRQDGVEWSDLGEAEEIDRMVAAMRRLLRRPHSRARELKAVASDLYRVLMKKALALSAGNKRLLICPDSTLNLLPFDALVDEHGKYLVESYEVSYLTSGRDLLRLGSRVQSREDPVVIADPDYGKGPGPLLLGKQYEPLQPLKETVREAESLKQEFSNVRLAMREKATKQLLQSVSGPKFLHIATHGAFLDTNTDVVDNARNITVLENGIVDDESVRSTNPLLRSYLFFTGTNDADSQGTMTALELTSMDFWGTKQVVLSACDTGVGEVKAGEGVYGLRRALLLAGSEAQVMSLWPVSDRATTELMVQYYKALKRGENKSSAIRQIRLAFLKKPHLQHPYYWASFILSGDWRSFD